MKERRGGVERERRGREGKMEEKAGEKQGEVTVSKHIHPNVKLNI